MNTRPVKIAVCAPASYGFVAREDEAATVRMIKGRETSLPAIRAHVDRILAHHLRLLSRAGTAGARLAVLPEDILRLGGLIREQGRKAFCSRAVAEAYAVLMDRIGALCRSHGMHVVAGTATLRGSRYYNTALLIGADGRLIGAYNKTHIPRSERGVFTPGDALPVFDTTLGRIGMLICWDILFPETFGALAAQGAEFIVQPTFGHSEEADDIRARCRALDSSVPLAIAMWDGPSGIVDAAGNYVARTGHRRDAVAVATLDLAAPRKWLWMNNVREELAVQRQPELYRATYEASRIEKRTRRG